MKIKLLIALALAAGAGFLINTFMRNTKAMDDLIKDGLEVLEHHFTVKEIDPGEYSTIRIYGVMPFHVKQYLIEGVGNLSVMTVNMGLMQMSTFVVTPLNKDMPLLSIDYIYMLSNRKALLEFYDLTEDRTASVYQDTLKELTEVAASYGDLKDEEAAPAWYHELMTVFVSKSGKAGDDSRLHELFKDMVSCWAGNAESLPGLDEASKEKKQGLISDYANNLVDKGGVSTDVFKKFLGTDKTKEFFSKVFFGYDAD